MAKKIKSTRMTKVCQSEGTIEFETPSGGTLVYGPCRRHGWFMAMIHCSPADVKQLAVSLLEAAENAEARGGQHGNQDAGKASDDEKK